MPCRTPRVARRGRRRVSLFRDAAREIKTLLDDEGVADMPLGVDVVEPPMLFELQKQGVEVRDGQQVMLAAREVKNIDEIRCSTWPRRWSTAPTSTSPRR